MTKVGSNPNDTLPPGKPLDPDRIVSEEDAGSAEIEQELQEERDDQVIKDEFEGLDNDLVNVGKFSDEAADNEETSRTEGDEEQPGLA